MRHLRCGLKFTSKIIPLLAAVCSRLLLVVTWVFRSNIHMDLIRRFSKTLLHPLQFQKIAWCHLGAGISLHWYMEHPGCLSCYFSSWSFYILIDRCPLSFQTVGTQPSSVVLLVHFAPQYLFASTWLCHTLCMRDLCSSISVLNADRIIPLFLYLHYQ